VGVFRPTRSGYTSFEKVRYISERKLRDMKSYTLSACEDLISRYVNDYKGEVSELEEGCLGLGVILLHSGINAKTIVIREVYVNAWVSTHTIRKYNKIPKKYQRLI